MMQSQIRKPLLLLLGCFMFLATSRASTYIPYDDDGHIGCEEKWNELIRSSNLLDVQTQITKIRSDQDETTFQAEVSFPDSNIKLGNQGSKIYSHKTLDHEFKKLVMTCTETFMKHVFWEVPKYGEAISSEEILKILNSIERGQGVNTGANASMHDDMKRDDSGNLVAQVVKYSKTLNDFKTSGGKASKDSYRTDVYKLTNEYVGSQTRLNKILMSTDGNDLLGNEDFNKELGQMFVIRSRLLHLYSTIPGRFGLDVLKQVRDLHNQITASVSDNGLIKSVYSAEWNANPVFRQAVSYKIPELEQ
eukprot:700010_1